MFATWRKGKGDLSDVYRCYSCSTSRQWMRRRQENNYFTNIVRELAPEDTPAYHQIMRMKFEHFTAILRFLFWWFFLLEVWSIFCAASSLADIFKLHWREQTVSMVTAEFAVLMRVRACNMLLRPAKRTRFHSSNMRTKEMLDDVGSNVWYCIKHVLTSSNMLSGHQTRWPNDKMLVHPTCWVVQHLSFGRALRRYFITSSLIYALKSTRRHTTWGIALTSPYGCFFSELEDQHVPCESTPIALERETYAYR